MRISSLCILSVLLPVAMVAGAVPSSPAFQAEDSCTVAYVVEPVPACEAEHGGVVHEAACRANEWDPTRHWCGLTWSLNGTFQGATGVWKRLWLWQSWEGGFSAAVMCEAYSREETLTCGEERGIGVLASFTLGECRVMLLRLIGEMLPVTWPEYYYSPLGYAESVTRVELCRGEDGSLPFRVL